MTSSAEDKCLNIRAKVRLNGKGVAGECSAALHQPWLHSELHRLSLARVVPVTQYRGELGHVGHAGQGI